MNGAEDMLRRYIEAVSIPLVNTDNEKYPIRAGRVTHLFIEDWSREFIEDLEEAKNSGLSYSNIGRLFGNPTRIMRMSHHIIRGAKKAGFSLQERERLVLELLRILKTMKIGNIFCEDKKNILLSDEEIKRILTEKEFIEANQDSAKLVQRLCGIMWAYSETPYFAAHEISMEEHGPYERHGHVIIRDFYNLRPIELWSECGEFPFEKLRILCVYDEDYNVEFDVYGNLYLKNGNPVLSLKSYYIEADSRAIDMKGVTRVLDTGPRIIGSITKRVAAMNEVGIAKKYAELFWYRKKPLRDALGKDWRPPKIVFEKIERGEIKPEIKKSPNPGDIKERIGLI